MFEDEKEAVEALRVRNDTFRRLYEKYATLKSRVRDANLGAVAMDDATLENLKKEKLLLKDRMAAMIRDFHLVHQ
ncbi:MAG: DUF465 domain-containing protein [Gammaproteobacteria bacterium]|nr:DUF465 domain-containing protein [Gammaproteobacteria bacterium]NNM01887.1 DUF465 domain-containing protein [Gammaproteobacteria bacterium]